MLLYCGLLVETTEVGVLHGVEAIYGVEAVLEEVRFVGWSGQGVAAIHLTTFCNRHTPKQNEKHMAGIGVR